MEKELQTIMDELSQRTKDDRLERFRHPNKLARKGQILFTGSSLMEQFPIDEILQNHGRQDLTIYNRGIGGYTIPEMLRAVHEQILDLEPHKIFINIGTNDLNGEDFTPENFRRGYREILSRIREHLPECEVYLMAYYPVNLETAKNSAAADWAVDAVRMRMERLPRANEAVQELAEEFSYHYIDVNAGLTGADGQTRPELSIDGIHMWPEAYEIVYRNLEKYL